MKDLQSYIVQTDKYIVKIVTDCSDILSYLTRFCEELNKLAFRFDIVTYTVNEIDAVITYLDKNSYELKFNNKTDMLFICPWKEICNSTMFAMIFRYLVEVLRQNNDEIKLHASSIYMNGKTALFLAPSEGGKTTISMAMCRMYDCLFKANDASIIKLVNEVPFMLRGDEKINARKNGLYAYVNSMNDNILQNKNINESLHNQKICFFPEDIAIHKDSDVRQVTHLFFVKLDSCSKDTQVLQYSTENINNSKDWFKCKKQIYQNIGGTIKGGDFIPYSNTGEVLPIIIPSLDNDVLNLKRIHFINKLFKSCNVYQIRGRLENITKKIHTILEEK